MWLLLCLPFCWCFPQRQYTAVVVALVVGAIWAEWQVQSTLAMWVPKSHIGDTVLVKGELVPFSWQETETHYGARRYSFRSEEHTSELHHVSISYAVFCLKKKIACLPLLEQPGLQEKAALLHGRLIVFR